jgi:hypothetical protein
MSHHIPRHHFDGLTITQMHAQHPAINFDLPCLAFEQARAQFSHRL